jgi:fatty acid desaturase
MASRRTSGKGTAQRLRQHYRERRRRVLSIVAVVVAGLVGVVVAAVAGWVRSVWPLFAAWLGVSAVLALVAHGLWRCPKCDRFFGLSLSHDRCPKCGFDLRD